MSLDLVLLHCSKISNIFRSILFSMFISTSDVCYRILPDNHRKLLHISFHSESMNTCKREPHVFFWWCFTITPDEIWHINRCWLKISFICSKVSFIWYQPQSSGLKHSRSRLLHSQTCEWTRKAWKCIALSDGGRFCGLRVKEIVTLPINLACLSDARVSASFP